MPARELLQLPNLVSLSRILLAPIIGYLLWIEGEHTPLLVVILMAVAGITDGLDGYLARRMGQVSRLGIALDPIADKIFAGLLVIILVYFRDFPIWLAAFILGRDLLIVALGAVLMRGRELTLPSNLTGKYAFGCIAVLLTSYVIRFPFGITVLTWLTVILLVASTINYARVFVAVRRGLAPTLFKDRPVYRNGRSLVTWSLSLWYLAELYRHLWG